MNVNVMLKILLVGPTLPVFTCLAGTCEVTDKLLNMPLVFVGIHNFMKVKVKLILNLLYAIRGLEYCPRILNNICFKPVVER